MAGSRPWTAADETAGLLDGIFRALRTRFPDVAISRLVGTHAADDDGVFWVRHADVEVQIDASNGGAAPFTVEGSDPASRLDTSDPGAVLEHVERLLGGA